MAGIKEVSFDFLESVSIRPEQRYGALLPRQMQAGSFAGTAEISIGGDNNIKIDGANRRIIINDGTDDRLVLGLFPDGDYGLVVSKPGEDVLDAFS